MSELIGWAVTALVVTLLLSFVAYLVTLNRIPGNARARTPTYDRFGRRIGATENPDYHLNPGEDHAEEPDVAPTGPS